MMWVSTIAGTLLILVALRDIFHTLWHPGGFGRLSRVVFGSIWRVSKLGPRDGGSVAIAGPLGLLVTISVWAVLVSVGFGLLYLPHMPRDFYFGSSLVPQLSSDLVASLYLSLVALTTLGLGDIQPATPLLRLLVPVEALLGFLLLTAGISWILQLYPALNRRRALSRRLTSMARCDAARVVATGEPSIAVAHLESVRGELATVEVDLVQYGESYYFRELRADLSLAAALPQVMDLVAAGTRSSSAEVRNAAAMLDDGLREFLTLLREDFLGDVGDVEATMGAFAADHLQLAQRAGRDGR